MNNQDHERLVDIHAEMMNLLSEAEKLIRRENSNPIVWERAKSYWVAHIKMALSNDHSYIGRSGCTMEDTIRELDPGEEEDYEQED
jgi:hypothetical protein